VIVVSHGWALTMLFAAVQNWDYVEAFREQRLQFGNTSVSVVEIGADGSRTCTLLNCTRYLPETAGSDCNP
jgi:broad specificity phosphatase PhoE